MEWLCDLPGESANTEGYANWPAIPAIKQTVEKKRKRTASDIDLINLVSDDVIAQMLI